MGRFRTLHAVEHELLFARANEDVAIAAARDMNAIQRELAREHARPLLPVGVYEQHALVSEHERGAVGERVHRPCREEPPHELPDAVRGEADDFRGGECALQHRLCFAEDLSALAIAPADSALVGSREHFGEANRNRRWQERLELLFWLTPPRHTAHEV